MTIQKLRPSFTFTQDRLTELQAVVPEAFADGAINWDVLKEALGAFLEDEGRDAEHFGLFWPGKREARRLAAIASKGTLKPVLGEGVNEDTTGNIFIEGDNLEVLKLLQKSYAGRVKMIYIDPPYNTGNDLVYKDDFREPLEDYLMKTGQMDEEGKLLTTNTIADGRFHSNWLSLMYPRLYLSRQLLREDGVIFVSIDDHEAANLRKIMDEIFGEENFVGQFIVNSTPNARDYGHIGKMHEYVLFYVKDILYTDTNLLPDPEKSFRYEDSLGPFNIHPLYNSNVAFTPTNRKNLYYPFYLNPDKQDANGFFEISLLKKDGLIEIYPPMSVKGDAQFVWRWGKIKSEGELNKEIVGYKTEDGEFRIVQKMRHSAKLIRSLLLDKDFTSRRGTAEVEELFGQKIFSFPKPINLIKVFIQISTQKNDIVFDPFAGSATTAHAVLELNREDGGNRRFIIVQLPEKTGIPQFPTVADIGKERIRLAIAKMEREDKSKLDLWASNKPLDKGFKVFKLDRSNYKAWQNYQGEDIQELETLFDSIETPLIEGWSRGDLLTEILLMQGFPLDSSISVHDAFTHNTILLVDSDVCTHRLFVCLDDNIADDTIEQLHLRSEDVFVCLDSALTDQVKMRLADICNLNII